MSGSDLLKRGIEALAIATFTAPINSIANNIGAWVVKYLDEMRTSSKGLETNISSIKFEFQMKCAGLDIQLQAMSDPPMKLKYMELMRELSFDIEDCLDRLLRCSKRGESPDDNLKKEVECLATKLRTLRPEECLATTLRTLRPDGHPYNVNMKGEEQLPVIGINDSKKELGELLNAHQDQKMLIVISIVGFSGSGKTTLAKAVYDEYDGTRDWIDAPEHKDDTTSLLTALRNALQKPEKKRYLIVIDDIKGQQWNFIRRHIPKDKRITIIVTTTRQEVAQVCCGAESDGSRGYVYNMKNLDKSHSMELLQAVLGRTVLGLKEASPLIMEKCDGHPLSLVTVARYLQQKYEVGETHFENFWNKLEDKMKDEEIFEKLRQILLDNYCSLPGQSVKSCLMYTCVFPNGQPIKRTRLIRRWLAEGYVTDPDPYKADDHLENLIDRNIIRQIHPSKNAKVKTCRTHGIMHEFMRNMAMLSTNKLIISLSSLERGNYRHLFSERQPSSTRGDAKDKFRAHSLTICGRAGEAVEDLLSKCELLRVLDLEECIDLQDKYIDCIRKLWHLKYLSLGATISRIPKGIKDLHFLETLDIRKTEIEMLPMEVFKLPNLTRLLGKFKLEERLMEEASELKEFEKQKSNLQTLKGFVTDDHPGSSLLMICMKKLRKVKIWCDSLGDKDSQSSAALVRAIQQFIDGPMENGDDYHSLSLELGNYSKVILGSLRPGDPSGYLSSLKLHGALEAQTGFVAQLSGLKELCLSSTNHLTQKELSKLGKLIKLEYLKLVKVSLKDFVIGSEDFRPLRRLCLVQCQSLPTIKQGALPDLLSLRLLNQDLGGPSGIKIKQHKLLQELALDSDVKPKIIRMWEDAAKKHPKRPRVLFFKRNLDRTGSVVKYVATDRPAQTKAPSVVEGSTDLQRRTQNIFLRPFRGINRDAH